MLLFLFEKYGILQNKFDDDLSSMGYSDKNSI